MRAPPQSPKLAQIKHYRATAEQHRLTTPQIYTESTPGTPPGGRGGKKYQKTYLGWKNLGWRKGLPHFWSLNISENFGILLGDFLDFSF